MKTMYLLLLGSLLIFSCKSETDRQEEPAEELKERSLEENALIPDSQKVDTSATGPEIQPVSHATAVISWGGTNIYLDPTGGAAAFEGMDAPDFVLITDIHADHMDPETLGALDLGETPIIVPQAVKEELPEALQQQLLVMNNGDTRTEQGIGIEAIPMYNLREEALQYHEKGRGNGYVLERNGIRLYIAGDTEDIPEMRGLEDIDIALIPMNLPYTMPVDRAADAVIEFPPAEVYPYHFRGTEGMADVDRFESLVKAGNPDVEVVRLEWYPEE